MQPSAQPPLPPSVLHQNSHGQDMSETWASQASVSQRVLKKLPERNERTHTSRFIALWSMLPADNVQLPVRQR